MNEKILSRNLLIIVTIFSLISLVLFLTHENIDFTSSINSDKFGHFGTFYGGILSTIIAGFAFYLLYVTYKSQNAQLNLAKMKSKLELVTTLYTEILKDIESIRYKEFKGIDALYNFDKEHWNNPNSVMNHLISIINSIEGLIEIILNDKELSDNVKDMLLTKVYFLFISKIMAPARNIYNDRVSLGLDTHPDTEIIVDKYEKLTKESHEYLIKKNKIRKPVDGVIKKTLES